MLECDNKRCIYWRDGRCFLRAISLDHRGMCRECIDVDVPEDVLDRERQAALARYAKEERSWPPPLPHFDSKSPRASARGLSLIYACALGLAAKVIWFSFSVRTTSSPTLMDPSSSASARASSTLDWMARLSGRAP